MKRVQKRFANLRKFVLQQSTRQRQLGEKLRLTFESQAFQEPSEWIVAADQLEYLLYVVQSLHASL